MANNVIQSAISSIRRKADEILNDNQGWFRGGKFTPVQQVQSKIQQNIQTNPLDRMAFSAIKTVSTPVVKSLANIGALGATGLGAIQMARNKPESAERLFNTALNARRFAGTEGSFDQGTKSGLQTLKTGGLSALQTALTGKGIKYTTPTNLALGGLIGGTANKLSGGDFATGFGQGAGNTPQIMGFVGATNPLLNKLIPQTASNIGGRLAGAGLNVAQGLGMDVARGTPTTLGSVALDVATGLAGGKGQFETGGTRVSGMTGKNKMTFKPKSILKGEEIDIIDQINERLGKTKDISWEDNNFLDNVLKQRTNATQVQLDNLTAKQKLNELLTFANRSEGFKGVQMGITDQPIKTGGNELNPIVNPKTGETLNDAILKLRNNNWSEKDITKFKQSVLDKYNPQKVETRLNQINKELDSIYSKGQTMTKDAKFSSQYAKRENAADLLLKEKSELEQIQREIPKTIRTYRTSKTSNKGFYEDTPIIRKEENITLYQGSKPGEQRQFWTPNKKYAEKFGDVKEKTGDFYLIDNGNMVTDVYVEVPNVKSVSPESVSKPKIVKISQYTESGKEGKFWTTPEGADPSYGSIKNTGYVDDTKLYQGESSYNFLKERGLLTKEVKAKLDATDESPNPNEFYKITEDIAEKVLKKEGYSGAHWKYEDDLNPTQYQIWDKSIISNKPSNLSPESKGIKPALIDKKIDLGVTPQKEIVPEMGKVEQPQIGTGKLTTQVKQGSVPTGKVKLKTDQIVSRSPSTTSITPKGKLNTSKLNLTDEQRSDIDIIQDNIPVTVISNKEVIDASRTTQGRKTVLTDEMQKKILAQQLNSRQEVVSLQKQYDKLIKSGADELELIALKEKIIKQSKVSQQERTFAGRLLQSGNIMANELATPEQKIYALLDNAGVDSKKYIKDAINVDFNNPTQVVNFYRKYVPPKFSEVLDEIRYSNMLSSPLTQTVNTNSNIIQSLIVKPIEKIITGQLDWVKSKLTGKERQYYASQGIDYAKGTWKSLPDAWTKFKSIASGKEINLRPDMEFIPTTTKGPLKWYTTPLRVLEASDQFFRTLVQSGEKKSLSRLKLSDQQIAKRAAESADYTLFRQKFDPDGELGQGGLLKVWDKWNTVMSMARRLPGGKWVVPFLQTPTNILKQGFEYSPLGVTTMIGAKRPLEQLSKAIIGTAVFSTVYGLADTGQITWSVPTNAKEKELFYAAGLQPYSLKIGNKWISFAKLGPLSYPMAMAAALRWAEKNNPDQNFGENLIDAIPQMIKFFGDQSYVRSLGDTIDSIKSSNSDILNTAINKQFSNLAGQLVPYRSFQGWLTRMIDPIYRKPEGIGENLMAQVPGLSTNVPAYTDIYGEESKRDLPVLNAFSPLKVSVEKPETASLLKQQQELNIEKAQIKKEGEKLGLSEAKDSIKKGGEAKIVGNSIIYYDDGVKTLDLNKLDDINKLPSDNKYNSAIRESKQYSEAAKIMDNTALTTEQQQMALDRLGIDKNKADYYRIANDSDNLKTMFVLDAVNNVKTQGGGLSDIISLLANQRTEINGKMIASNGVLDNLVDEGILTKSQATQLKKYKFENGQLVPKSKTGTKTKKVKVTLRKMSTPKLSSSGKVKRIKVPKKTYKKLKVRKLRTVTK